MHLTEQNPYLRASSMSELLFWNDADFVRCAYVTVLGRQPDPEGEAYYTNHIRMGRSKLEILGRLRMSPEGRQHDPGISGFDKALRRAAWARNRYIGWLVRLFAGGEGDNAAWYSRRALANQVSLLSSRSQAPIYHEQFNEVTVLLTSVSAVLARVDQTLASLTEREPPQSLSEFAQDAYRALGAARGEYWQGR